MVVDLPGGVAATVVNSTDAHGRDVTLLRAGGMSFRLVATGGGYCNVYGDDGHRLYSGVRLPV